MRFSLLPAFILEDIFDTKQLWGNPVTVRTMWTIGIKSGLITVLGLIAYGLAIHLLGLEPSVQYNLLAYAVLALGIYSGYYYYKADNDGLMTYKQGLKLGLITTSFAGMLNVLPTYLYARLVDADIILRVAEDVQNTLQRNGTDGVVTEKITRLAQHVTPELLLTGSFVSTFLPGFIFTLIIAAFSRSPRGTPQT